MSCTNKFHLLEINHLSISFGEEKPISDLTLSVHTGELVAMIGASGSGKSLLTSWIFDLLPSDAVHSGEIKYHEKTLGQDEKQKVISKQVALVPQSLTYLDPLMKIGKQILGNKKGKERKEKLFQLMEKYKLKKEVANYYPFQCSGGMGRRILLCAALLDEPDLIIADEPTPGLDMQLAKLAMADFRSYADEGNGVLLITHDLELALLVADRIIIFNEGKTVEEIHVADFLQNKNLKEDYTKELFQAMKGLELI